MADKAKPITSKKPPLPPIIPKPKNPDRANMTKEQAIADNERMVARRQAQKDATKKFDAEYGKKDESETPVSQVAKTPAQVRAAKKKK